MTETTLNEIPDMLCAEKPNESNSSASSDKLQGSSSSPHSERSSISTTQEPYQSAFEFFSESSTIKSSDVCRSFLADCTTRNDDIYETFRVTLSKAAV